MSLAGLHSRAAPAEVVDVVFQLHTRLCCRKLDQKVSARRAERLGPGLDDTLVSAKCQDSQMRIVITARNSQAFRRLFCRLPGNPSPWIIALRNGDKFFKAVGLLWIDISLGNWRVVSGRAGCRNLQGVELSLALSMRMRYAQCQQQQRRTDRRQQPTKAAPPRVHSHRDD